MCYKVYMNPHGTYRIKNGKPVSHLRKQVEGLAQYLRNAKALYKMERQVKKAMREMDWKGV